jgi:multiple sugar transport system substrate-binding protein
MSSSAYGAAKGLLTNLLAGCCLLAGAYASETAAQTKPDNLNIISHIVHQRAAIGSAGDITKAWQEKNGIKTTWLTFDIPPLFERLVREGSLSESSIDIVFVLNSQLSPNVVKLLEPLDAYEKADPIEDFADIFKGMTDATRVGGKLYAIPFRQTPSGLHYNEEYFAERGITKVPETIEELIEAAKKLTYTRADGTKVHGLIFTGNHYANIIDFARAWNGDFITTDYRVAANEPAMINAIEAITSLYKDKVLPPNFAQLKSDDIDTWMQSGRAAMSIATISKTKNYNDPKNSKFPGKLKVANLPSSASVKAQFPVAPVKVEFWSMAILKNSKNKQAAWSLIKAMASKEATLTTALNGNGPVRNSTYDDPRYRATLPWAEVERRSLSVARIPVPPFDNVAKAGDFFLEGQQSVMLGGQTAKAAMDEVVERVKPLLPAAQ